jgi:hypothetical protein
LRVLVTATNSGGSASATSAMTSPVSSGTNTITFGVAASGDDGNLTARGSTYPPSGSPTANTSGAVMTAGRRFAFGAYENVVALIRFDTSALPDNATITSAKLRVYLTAKADADGRNLVAEWYSASHWPILADDYTLSPQAVALRADITSIPTQAVVELPFETATGVSTTGFSGLRLFVDGDQPVGDNYVQMASWDNTTLPEAQLVVTYTTP